MIYVVSGFMRSGTSMMMDALSAGGRIHGLPCAWSRERDARMNEANGDDQFRPNESYREVDLDEYADLTFPLKYDHSLIKVMSWGLEQLRRTSGLRVVFMLRDPQEIAESHRRAFGHDLMVTENGVRLPASESTTWPAQYRAQMKAAIVRAETRCDCLSLHVMDYREVLADPLKHFQRLESCGWPIDAETAASQVQPERQRVAC